MIRKLKSNKLAELKRNHKPKLKHEKLWKILWTVEIYKLPRLLMKICLWIVFSQSNSSVSMWDINSMKFLRLKKKRPKNLKQSISRCQPRLDNLYLIKSSNQKQKAVTKQSRLLFSVKPVVSSTTLEQRVHKSSSNQILILLRRCKSQIFLIRTWMNYSTQLSITRCQQLWSIKSLKLSIIIHQKQELKSPQEV